MSSNDLIDLYETKKIGEVEIPKYDTITDLVKDKNLKDTKFLEPAISVKTNNSITSELIQNKPIQQRPIQEKPVQQRPIQQRPIQEKPVQQRPIQEKPVQQRPIQQRPIQEKPIQQRPINTDPDFIFNKINHLLVELDNDNTTDFFTALNLKLKDEYDEIYPNFEYFKENVINNKIKKHNEYLEEKNLKLHNIEVKLQQEKQKIYNYDLEQKERINIREDNIHNIQNFQDIINSKNKIIDVDSILTNVDSILTNKEALNKCVLKLYEDYNNEIKKINIRFEKISDLQTIIQTMQKGKDTINNSDGIDKIDKDSILTNYIDDNIIDLYNEYDKKILNLKSKNEEENNNNNNNLLLELENLEQTKENQIDNNNKVYSSTISKYETYEEIKLKIKEIKANIEQIEENIKINEYRENQLKNFLSHVKEKYSNIENNSLFKKDSIDKDNLDYVLNNKVILQLENEEIYEIAKKLNEGEYELIEYNYLPNCQIFGLIMYVITSFIGMSILKFNFLVIIELIAFTSIINGIILLTYNYLKFNKKETDNINALWTGGLVLGSLIYVFKGGLGLIKAYKILNIYVLVAILSVIICYIYMNQKTRIQYKSKILNDKYYSIAFSLSSKIKS